ncbi:Kunitz/Bovine pancreatic trypsin inhibitor domain protein [Ancylostoma caninum]|uniref:Kunitz/Bovine pancreatic trypsin inhibitor domain protein n=1 Tax=Ancylostoma caninum TaxID=29170 RepID=A0A368H8S7_ANCCA|nr:Kunitz/Bovine pancreatic trypsin inhibitor domain protein [Ancylostoma caninum]
MKLKSQVNDMREEFYQFHLQGTIMKVLPLTLLCVTVCYCLYYEGAGQNGVDPQQGIDSGSKGYQQQNNQQIVQIPTLPPYRKRCRGPPVLPGGVTCMAYMERYTYDERRRRCVKFIYGGCRATPNNFGTLKECKKICMNRPKHPTYHQS